MSAVMDTVRRIVGRRSKITREEMVAIIVALDLEPERSTIVGRYADGSLLAGEIRVEPVREDRPDLPPSMRAIDAVATRAAEQQAVARAWERACKCITCISVWGREHDGGGIRFDSPGSMAPMQHAELTFVAEALAEDREHDPVGYMRRHCDRLLIVRGEPTEDAPPEPEIPTVSPIVARLRKHPRIDGTWARILDDGTLEMRDPNSGQSWDPEKKPRFQYRVNEDGDLVERRLPPASVGDAWVDIGAPEWEYIDTPPRDELLRDYWEAHVL